MARVEGSSRNRRDPSAQPLSGQGAPYKPSAKSATAQRGSEGIVVPMRPVQQNAGRGKGPCGGRVGSGGKREGMAGQDPVQPPSRALARLQSATTPTSTVGCCQASSRETNPCPYDRIHRRDVLWEAWRREIESQERVIGDRRSCTGPTQRYDPRSGGGVMQQPERPSVSRVREGAADKAATQLVRVQPCQLSMSDMKRRHIPGWVTAWAMRGVKGPAARRRETSRSEQPGGQASVGARR